MKALNINFLIFNGIEYLKEVFIPKGVQTSQPYRKKGDSVLVLVPKYVFSRTNMM